MFDKILTWSIFLSILVQLFEEGSLGGGARATSRGMGVLFLFLVYLGTRGGGEIFLSFSSSTQVVVGAVHSRVLSFLPPQLSLLPTNTT